MNRCVPLEAAAEKVCDDNSTPPLIFELPPEEGRQKLNEAQNSPVFKFPAKTRTLTADTGDYGCIDVHFITPETIIGTPGVIFYIHGAGWVFGNLHTHEKLVRELAARTNSIVVFPEYSLSPEAKYPTAIEQCYSVLKHLPGLAKRFKISVNFKTLTVAGDSVGGNMAAAMTLMAKQRGGPHIHKQLMYYPVTNAAFNTRSYTEFECGYYLYREGMIWFWDQYTTSEKARREITASPLRATCNELRGLPPAMIINGEADVLRDEGEEYATKLLEAGVEVTALRVRAIIHDFVMLNALNNTNACRAAMDASTEWINRKNCEVMPFV